jgi:PadR family transcriptional regulator
VRRKPGTLLPLELAVLVVAVDLAESGTSEFHGYDLARRLADIADHRLLTAYGTLYRTLGRLETMALLTSHWEDPAIPARENRPGRRFYAVTAAGVAAVRRGSEVRGSSTPDRNLGT